jgi:hypothetical protein
VSWVHLLPAALEIILWLDSEADTTDSEYFVASRARGPMDRLARDLQIAGVEMPDRHRAHGVGYLPAFAEANDSLLAQLGTGD